ncbi:polysaccharide pyruvyl transferase family protein [uncultured Jannaschia sp.]|uniref:polysaccharide pyruvyl transferase family protein n=1 Tax=uncultured Jannaschia sp. TaxID=293347 RepID=UPI00260D24C2|nr:polysaccharide pyruvyl transferase family protein [uncultured Jannaschia sp.]
MLDYEFESSSDTGFVGIGSILSDVYVARYAKRIVFGAGVRRPGRVPDLAKGSWDFRFVRGPLSAKACGGVPYISDPAILAPLRFEEGRHRNGFTGGTETGFVRYFKSPRSQAKAICEELGMVELDPTFSPDEFLSRLSRCRRVVSEAMHGAILADAFRIPWVGIRLNSDRHEGRTAGFKWRDWAFSLELPASVVPPSRPLNLLPYPIRMRIGPSPTTGQAIAKVRAASAANAFHLSDTSVLRKRQAQIMSEITRLKKELGPARS